MERSEVAWHRGIPHNPNTQGASDTARTRCSCTSMPTAWPCFQGDLTFVHAFHKEQHTGVPGPVAHQLLTKQLGGVPTDKRKHLLFSRGPTNDLGEPSLEQHGCCNHLWTSLCCQGGIQCCHCSGLGLLLCLCPWLPVAPSKLH